MALRSVDETPDGRRVVTFAVSARVLVDGPELFVVTTAPGSEVMLRAGAGQGPNGRLVPLDAWDGSYARAEWHSGVVVRVHRRGDAWSVWRWHDGLRWSDAWYGNLEEPWTRSGVGYDTRDWVLDVVVEGRVGEPSWRVRYKDADELAWMVARGLVSAGDAHRVHDVGERLTDIAERGAWPFDAEWDTWLPAEGAEREPTLLPAGWDRA